MITPYTLASILIVLTGLALIVAVLTDVRRRKRGVAKRGFR